MPHYLFLLNKVEMYLLFIIIINYLSKKNEKMSLSLVPMVWNALHKIYSNSFFLTMKQALKNYSVPTEPCMTFTCLS